MNPLFLLATTEASHSHSVMDALPHLAGALMVMATLAILWGICAATAKLLTALKPETKPVAPVPATADAAVAAPAAAAPAAAETSSSAPEIIAPDIVAVIAAAVATVTGNKPIRIISIKPMSTSWERAGRQSVLTSHRIR